MRHGGLFRYRDGAGWAYFTVMCSIFDPARPIDQTYDLKGSTYGRKKKETESDGKDEDWLAENMRLKVPSSIRREFRMTHEMDAKFLSSFGVMDYSLLVGIHTEPTVKRAGWCDGFGGAGALRVDNKVYFYGVIDFLIRFGIQKDLEKLVKVDVGHLDASCVDPASYAMRQVKFVSECVLEPPELRRTNARPRCELKDGCYITDVQHKKEYSHPHDSDWRSKVDDFLGTRGTLHVEVSAGHKLPWTRRGGTLSVEVRLGLQRCATPAVDSSDPCWDSKLNFAVDPFHYQLEHDVEFHLWNSSESLGKVLVPLRDVQRPQDRRLQFPHGELSVKMHLFLCSEGAVG